MTQILALELPSESSALDCPFVSIVPQLCHGDACEISEWTCQVGIARASCSIASAFVTSLF